MAAWKEFRNGYLACGTQFLDRCSVRRTNYPFADVNVHMQYTSNHVYVELRIMTTIILEIAIICVAINRLRS